MFGLDKKVPALAEPLNEKIFEGAPVLHLDPFGKQYIEYVFIWVRRDYKGRIEFEGTVKFTRENTSAEHKITADDFPSLVEKIQSFIQSL